MLPPNDYNYPVVQYLGSIFSLQDLRDEEVVQNSLLLKLKDSVLDKIVEYVPLKDRILKLRPVCRRLSSSVKRSVKSVEFLRDELDYCDDVKISFFLALYGKTVEHMNYDLFRSCSLREYTQWSWRQSVISSVTRCRQLKQLDILICCRHRLRDMDLQVIFKQCAELEVLRMDASFINGRCFANAPETLRKVELECCQTFTRQAFVAMCSRLSRLTTLHVSLLQTIDDYAIKKSAT
uniref:F-box domain-containing protein n=1 Tax=Caenorhabditis tropicalis TaxID=1561998 RepID=A0A1I7T2I9_9PELO